MLNHSWNASPQSGHRSFICSQKEGMRRRTNADRQDYVEEIVWKVEKKSTDANSQNTPIQHKLKTITNNPKLQ